MAKRDKRANVDVPDGMKCYQKVGGGSFRFPNRIIKPGQKFWTYPDALPKAFKDVFKEVPSDYGAIVVETTVKQKQIEKELDVILEKFEMVKARDKDGEFIKKGNSNLYNVVGEDGKPLNEKPLRKAKAQELLDSVNL